MKKYLLFASALFFSTSIFSQIQYGIKAGVNIANQVLQIDEMGQKLSESGKTIPSFHLGFFAEIPLSKNVMLAPELLLSGLGANFKGTDLNGNPTTAKVRPYYLSVPIDILYNHKLKNNMSLFIGAGPNFSYGLFGKASGGGFNDTSVNVFATGGFKRFDFGVNFIGGIELSSGLRITANYTLGLTSIARDDADLGDGTKWKNRVFSISVGYALKKRK